MLVAGKARGAGSRSFGTAPRAVNGLRQAALERRRKERVVAATNVEKFAAFAQRMTASSPPPEVLQETKRIVLDLAQVGYVDSAGLGVIVRLWSSAQKAGCALKITNLAPRIKELLAMTNLASIFES